MARRGIHTRGGKLPPWGLGYGHIPVTGQSLGAGFYQNPVTVAQPFGNVQYSDTTAAYLLTAPFSGAGTLIPLVCPVRANVARAGGAYPLNIAPGSPQGGETPEVTMANELTRFALASGYVAFNLATTNVAIGGAAMAVIQKGGSGTAYAAAIAEATALAFQAKRRGVPYQALASGLTHGEADAQAGTTIPVYQAGLVTLAQNYASDLAALSANPARPIPMVLSQQNTEPIMGVQGANNTALAMWKAFVANPTLFLLSGPKYQFGPGYDNLHLQEYRGYGVKLAETLWRSWMGFPASCLYPTSITRSGNVVTINCYVPVPPLVLDSVQSPPHGIGTPWAKWAGSGGLEFHDCDMVVTGASNTSPITLSVASMPAGLANGDTVAALGVTGNTAANGVWVVANLNVGAGTFQLVGSSGNGAYVPPSVSPVAFRVISISGTPTIVNPFSFAAKIQVTLATTPAAGNLTVGCAHNADQFATATGPGLGVIGAWPSGRCSLWRDSDSWGGVALPVIGAGPWQRNWMIEFEQGGL